LEASTSSAKYCQHCKKTNHNTNDCRKNIKEPLYAKSDDITLKIVGIKSHMRPQNVRQKDDKANTGEIDEIIVF
jgi:ribosomal protein L44E